MFEAKIIEDSLDARQVSRLTTMQLIYPRFIHAEFMTHRVFSRNASSSRAIPVKKLIRMALDTPAMFLELGSNKPGMQAGEQVDDSVKALFEAEWKKLAGICAKYARRWSADYGLHKQIVNRVMEPWHHISVVVSATEWNNFFVLRDHPAAMPEIRHLAQLMMAAMQTSKPTNREHHLPYVTEEERQLYREHVLFQLSTARCARVSYMNHDGTQPCVQKDMELAKKLLGSTPRHSSPAEHPAMVANSDERYVTSNFNVPWIQYRKMIEHGRRRV